MGVGDGAGHGGAREGGWEGGGGGPAVQSHGDCQVWQLLGCGELLRELCTEPGKWLGAYLERNALYRKQRCVPAWLLLCVATLTCPSLPRLQGLAGCTNAGLAVDPQWAASFMSVLASRCAGQPGRHAVGTRPDRQAGGGLPGHDGAVWVPPALANLVHLQHQGAQHCCQAVVWLVA